MGIPPTTLVRAPSHDSAIIRSDRLGGNFAYSVEEGHAYAAVTPVVQHVSTPVAVAFEAPKYEVKTIETPTYEVKTIETPAFQHVAAPYAYGYSYGAPFAHYGSYAHY